MLTLSQWAFIQMNEQKKKKKTPDIMQSLWFAIETVFFFGLPFYFQLLQSSRRAPCNIEFKTMFR